jgi:hypothetical protein
METKEFLACENTVSSHVQNPTWPNTSF